MFTITASALVSAIQSSEAKGARPASLRLACPVKLLKKSRLDKAPCPFAGIVKHTAQTVFFAFDYSANVNAQREREGSADAGEFVAKENWFAHVSPAIVAHRTTGELYAYARLIRTLETPAFYDVDGNAIERAALVPFLPVDDLTEGERAAAGLPPVAANEWQGVQKEIRPFTVKLGNVRELALDGARYAIAATVEPATVATPAQPVAA